MEAQTSHDGTSDLAWATWFHYGDYPPTLTTTTNLKSKLGVRNNISSRQKILMSQRIQKYNKLNGTSHFVSFTKQGEADSHNSELRVNYLPVNMEKKRQRDFVRSEKDKMFYDFTDPSIGGIPGVDTKLTEEELEIVNRTKRNGTYLTAGGKASVLSARDWITTQTQDFRDFYGDSTVPPTQMDVDLFTASVETEAEVNAETETEVETETESSISEMEQMEQIELLEPGSPVEPMLPVPNAELYGTGEIEDMLDNQAEVEKEGVVGGSFVSMTVEDFNNFFPEYAWIPQEEKQGILNNIMNGNIKLTCGI